MCADMMSWFCLHENQASFTYCFPRALFMTLSNSLASATEFDRVVSRHGSTEFNTGPFFALCLCKFCFFQIAITTFKIFFEFLLMHKCFYQYLRKHECYIKRSKKFYFFFQSLFRGSTPGRFFALCLCKFCFFQIAITTSKIFVQLLLTYQGFYYHLRNYECQV